MRPATGSSSVHVSSLLRSLAYYTGQAPRTKNPARNGTALKIAHFRSRRQLSLGAPYLDRSGTLSPQGPLGGADACHIFARLFHCLGPCGGYRPMIGITTTPGTGLHLDRCFVAVIASDIEEGSSQRVLWDKIALVSPFLGVRRAEGIRPELPSRKRKTSWPPFRPRPWTL